MSDLQERLQATLGDAFTIQRELGGGGMSRVFLADEVALGRPIVLKVLPPEMGAAVNVERFRREIRLAASLQHPHIVPLHSAGQSGDLLYYTMPLVEGESLRAKLAREGELPIPEAIRIMRDVAEALAYAHAHGVVHRDIKPDNILISGHHALVTDFGVAKAVSAASGSSSLTSIGVALGTPAYMAPEQAAADPHVDARADLYALGVVGYEMLCGRPPFVGMSPQQVLAAQVTLTPEPCTAHRSSIPPALASLVMRCLEKKPADRVQRADELGAQLEAMATPSGGMAPTGAASAASPGSEAAMRLTNPVRVAALFVGAAVVMLAVTYFLVTRLGLPEWVLAGAITLLVVGFPIMLLTARRERERAVVSRTTRASQPPETGGAAGLLTWRNALMGGGLAFGGLTVLTGVYMAMRLLGIGPVGTLLAAGKLTNRQRVVLADFTNRTTDSTLGPTLTEAFRVDLAQSPTVQLEDPAAIDETLTRMQRPPATTLLPAVAREVAERQGVSAVITGEIDPVGAGYVLSATILSAHDGSVLTAVRSTARNANALIPALDELSKDLRERIGESLKSIRSDEPLEAVTTSSLDALRKYTAAVRISEQGHDEDAIPILEQATHIDTGFSMAYRKLAAALNNSRAPLSQANAAATEAYVHRDRLPEHERDLAVAYYHQSIDHDMPQAVASYQAALAMQPDDPIALTNLGALFNREGQFAAAESLLTRATMHDNGVPAYTDLLEAEVGQGQYGAADTTLTRLGRASPTFPHQLFFQGTVLSARRDFAGAERVVRAGLPHLSPTSPGQLSAEHILILLSEVQGKISQADSLNRAGTVRDEAHGSLRDYFGGILTEAELDIRFRDNKEAALSTILAALQRHPLASLPPADRPYAPLIHEYVGMRQLDRARRTWAEYQHEVPDSVRGRDPAARAAEGAIAEADGRSVDAVAGYRAFRDGSDCGTCGDFEIAEVFQHAGQPDSAIAYYTLGIDTPGLYRLSTDAYTLAASYQRLGELYEQRGDRAKAADYYGRLIDLWKNADPVLQPVVRDVHARLARLGGEHS